jgi:alkanesulfonate monooxygenase SsuD/methylene tetrahydromethanopterin reductase-like flavin-dependent oxidoreductase (luciferase family)
MSATRRGRRPSRSVSMSTAIDARRQAWPSARPRIAPEPHPVLASDDEAALRDLEASIP